MKSIIVYSSQTGNTRRVAEKIEQGIRSSGYGCTLRNLRETEDIDFSGYDMIGLGCPVHYYHESFDMRKWIAEADGLEGKTVFIFATHCTEIGDTLNSMASKIKSKGGRMVGAYTCYGEVTLAFYPKPYFTHDHPDCEELENAYRFGTKVHSLLSNDEILVEKTKWENASNTHTLEYVAKDVPDFHYDPEKCIQCELCMKNCPVLGIDVYANPVKIQTPCTYCLACVSNCPTAAINADWSSWIESVRQYGPEARRKFELAESQDKFVFHIDPDKVELDTPLIHKVQDSNKRDSERVA